jgi:hypothetical protein
VLAGKIRRAVLTFPLQDRRQGQGLGAWGLGLGGYETVSLSEARKTAKTMRAPVALGYDPALEKQERKAENKAKE